ncbi:MAG: sensor histidine kinase [Gaiellaceae bacterium]
MLDARDSDTSGDALERLRTEVAELRVSRERLVLSADADLRRIERDLHEGVQQHVVALAVNLQLAESLAVPDPAAAKTLLEEMRRDVQQAIDEAARLAERIYSQSLEMGNLAAALRAAAVSGQTPASVEVAMDSRCPPEVARTVYLCWLEALEHHHSETRATISVREGEGVLAFEVVADTGSDAGLEEVRDRVEALGGRLTIRPEPGHEVRLTGSLPLSR